MLFIIIITIFIIIIDDLSRKYVYNLCTDGRRQGPLTRINIIQQVLRSLGIKFRASVKKKEEREGE